MLIIVPRSRCDRPGGDVKAILSCEQSGPLQTGRKRATWSQITQCLFAGNRRPQAGNDLLFHFASTAHEISSVVKASVRKHETQIGRKLPSLVRPPLPVSSTGWRLWQSGRLHARWREPTRLSGEPATEDAAGTPRHVGHDAFISLRRTVHSIAILIATLPGAAKAIVIAAGWQATA